MTMKLIGVDAETAEDALVGIAGHLPVGASTGRPLVAWRDDDGVVWVLTGGCPPAVWCAQDGCTERMAGLPDGRAEVTSWRDGAEVSRLIGAVR